MIIDDHQSSQHPEAISFQPFDYDVRAELRRGLARALHECLQTLRAIDPNAEWIGNKLGASKRERIPIRRPSVGKRRDQFKRVFAGVFLSRSGAAEPIGSLTPMKRI